MYVNTEQKLVECRVVWCFEYFDVVDEIIRGEVTIGYSKNQKHNQKHRQNEGQR